MVKRANKGDKSALASVRELLKGPHGADLFGGNLARQAELSFIENAGGDQLAFKEAIGRKLTILRDELAGSNPTPLERLLVERVVACWLQVQDADVRYVQGQKDCTIPQSEYYQRRQDRAHNRYLSAMRTLAVVRKLTIPVVQVNIARKQVNVGQAQVNATAVGNGAVEGGAAAADEWAALVNDAFAHCTLKNQPRVGIWVACSTASVIEGKPEPRKAADHLVFQAGSSGSKLARQVTSFWHADCSSSQEYPSVETMVQKMERQRR